MKTSVLSTLGVFTTFCQPVSSGTSLLPRDEGGFKRAEFGYTDPIGPLQWSQLTPENSLCQSGLRQSPINLASTSVLHNAGLSCKVTIPDTNGSEFENLGTKAEVLLNRTMDTATNSYSMTQFHFHTPSEHSFEELLFPIESHFVFKAADTSVTVVAFLMTLGEKDSAQVVNTILSTVTQMTEPGQVTVANTLSFISLIAHLSNSLVMRYSGSLTLPCSEGVDWIISAVPRAINETSFLVAKLMMNFNARYNQRGLGKHSLLLRGTNIQKAPIESSLATYDGIMAPAGAALLEVGREMGW